MLFFNKKPKGYTPEQNALRNQFTLVINIDLFEPILSIERENLDMENEQTVVYVKTEDGTDHYRFDISREQHEQLVKDFLVLKKNKDATP